MSGRFQEERNPVLCGTRYNYHYLHINFLNPLFNLFPSYERLGQKAFQNIVLFGIITLL